MYVIDIHKLCTWVFLLCLCYGQAKVILQVYACWRCHLPFIKSFIFFSVVLFVFLSLFYYLSSLTFYLSVYYNEVDMITSSNRIISCVSFHY